MTPENNFILNLIVRGEDQHLELKEEANFHAVAEVVCGFLNSDGGQILLGVHDDGSIKGVSDANNKNLDLSRYLINNIVPESPITVSVEQIHNKDVILIKVLGGSKKPYIFDKRIYIRRGPATYLASNQEIVSLINDRQRDEVHWERQPALGVEVEDLDHEEIIKTIDYINESGRGKEKNLQVEQFLSYYGLYQNGNLTNAAVVLFAKEPARYLPQCRVRLAVFTTIKTGDFFTYDELLEGNLFKNVEAIQRILESITGVSSQFSHQNWQRIDKRRYPIQALREGVMNALIHRDYSNITGNLIISIYPNKLEISNFGQLPGTLSVSDLKQNHLSLPRNPDIAQICFLRGFIEKIGRGTLKIIEECKREGLREPRWVSKSGITSLTFFSGTFNTNPSVIDKSKLNQRQLNLVLTTSPGSTITIAEYVRTLSSLTDRTARNDLAFLIDGGWFKKLGAGRQTRYIRTDIH